MGSEQNVESAERATRTAVERFNEVFNGHDADTLARLLSDYSYLSCTNGAARNSELTSNGRQAGEYFQGTLSCRKQHHVDPSECD